MMEVYEIELRDEEGTVISRDLCVLDLDLVRQLAENAVDDYYGHPVVWSELFQEHGELMTTGRWNIDAHSYGTIKVWRKPILGS